MIPLIEENLDALRELWRRYNVERLDLCGSAAVADFDPERSDIDFVVQFAEMPPVAHKDCYFGLLFDLEDLLARSIDLLEATAVRNRYVRRSIDATKVLLCAASSAPSRPTLSAAQVPGAPD